MHDHLRPVPDAADAAPPENEKPSRAPARNRPTRALPSDRTKLHVQLQGLCAFVVESERGKVAVTPEEASTRYHVTGHTTGLMTGFFVEAGFLTKEGRGRYKPTEAAIAYQQKHSFKAENAEHVLAPALRESWYFQEVKKQLEMGETTEAQMVEVLAAAAGTDSSRVWQLRMILDWLMITGLITLHDGGVQLADGAADQPESDPEAEAEAKPEQHDESPAGPKVQKPTTPKGPKAPDQILGFSFDFTLTADDVKQLSAEQIEALFAAVGKLMAIKAGGQIEP